MSGLTHFRCSQMPLPPGERRGLGLTERQLGYHPPYDADNARRKVLTRNGAFGISGQSLTQLLVSPDTMNKIPNQIFFHENVLPSLISGCITYALTNTTETCYTS